jgi:hypothetical protein
MNMIQIRNLIFNLELTAQSSQMHQSTPNEQWFPWESNDLTKNDI